MNKKLSKIKIKFKNGEVRTLTPVKPNIRALKKDFKIATGINYDFEHQYFHTQITETLSKWIFKHGLYHPAAPDLVLTAAAIIAWEQRKQSGGFVAISEEDNECFLMIFPRNSNEYVWRISKMINDEICGKEVDNRERIVCVEYMEAELQTVEELEIELKEALKVEDYENAAILRDRISTMNRANKNS